MRLSEAMEGVREYIGDLGAGTWTDSRVARAIQAAIRKIHGKAFKINPEWNAQTLKVESSDLTSSDDGYTYTLPLYVVDVFDIAKSADGKDLYPFLQEGIKVSGFSGWRYSRLTPRTIVFADSSTYFIRYRKKITDQFKGESGNTSPATSTTNWKVQNVTLGKVTEGENVYAGERIAFNHGGLWTEGHVLSNTAPVDNVATFTVDAAATIEEKDIFETILPWKGLLDEEIQVVAAFILLTKEGHRRGQDGLAALYAEAMDQVEDLAGDIGKSQKGVRIEW